MADLDESAFGLCEEETEVDIGDMLAVMVKEEVAAQWPGKEPDWACAIFCTMMQATRASSGFSETEIAVGELAAEIMLQRFAGYLGVPT